MTSRLVTAATLVVACCATSAGQDPVLPANPRAWFNSAPMSLEMLRGKGVVLYFFEEG